MYERLLKQLSASARKMLLPISLHTRWMACLFICLTSAALLAEGYGSYKSELRKAAANADNLALLVGDRLISDVRAVDTLLANMVDTVDSSQNSSLKIDAIEGKIQKQLILTPVVDNLTLVSPEGKITYSRIGQVGANIGKLPFFKTLSENPAARSEISGVYQSPATKLPVISIAHRLRGPGNAFAGVVVADLDSFYFQRLLQNTAVGKHGSVILLHENGQLISQVSSPLDADIGANHSLPIPVGPRFDKGEGWTALGQFANSEDRGMYSVRSLPGVPFKVVVGLSGRDFLETWRIKVIIHSMFILLLAGLTIALERVLTRARRKSQELMVSEKNLERSKGQLQAVIETAPTAIAIIRLDSGVILLSNHAMGAAVGQRPLELEGRMLVEFFVLPNEAEQLLHELREQRIVIRREVQVMCGDEIRWLLVDATLIDFNEGQAAIIGGNDITERKMLEMKLEILATVDPLTGMANRRSFIDRAQIEYQRSRRTRRDLSVLMVDVDYFKKINDEHGHASGDRMLQHISEKIHGALRSTDFSARIGGDEFVVILPETSLIDAMIVASRIREEVNVNPIFSADGGQIFASVSIGLASLDREDATIDQLLHRADVALYVAKDRGRNQVVSGNGEHHVEKLVSQ